jgi:hypothetical protein
MSSHSFGRIDARLTKRYLVTFSNLSTTPWGNRPPAGARTVEFDDLAKAKEYARGVYGEWNWVVIYDLAKKGDLTRIETYRGGRRYWA